MKVLTTQVKRGGQIEMPSGLLSEGQMVTVVVHGVEEEFFDLPEEDERALLESMAEIKRGEYVDGWELLRDLEARQP